MANQGRPRRLLRARPAKELYYDGIKLVPVDRKTHRKKGAVDSWHIPGGEIATTAELVKRAEARGVDVVLHERTGARSRIVSLT